MQLTNEQKDSLEQLYSKIEDIKIAMLTSIDRGTGRLHSRPMSVIKTDERDGVLWFFTYTNSEKADEINHHTQVNLSYSDPDKEIYVSISGEAEVVDDLDKVKQLWNPILQAWFPDGYANPRVGLICVRITEGEYWDSSSNRMVQLYHIAKALFTGTAFNNGKHEKIDLGKR